MLSVNSKFDLDPKIKSGPLWVIRNLCMKYYHCGLNVNELSLEDALSTDRWTDRYGEISTVHELILAQPYFSGTVEN